MIIGENNNLITHDKRKSVRDSCKMPRTVTPDPLDMEIVNDYHEFRENVFPGTQNENNPVEMLRPELVRSVADVIPWDEDFIPEPPTLERQHAGDGTAVEWSSDEEEDLETVSIVSSVSSDDDFEERIRELEEEGRFLMNQMELALTLINTHTNPN